MPLNKEKVKMLKRQRRALRVSKRVRGTKTRPRISVFRSLRYISAQLIDDTSSKTLFSISSKALNLSGNKTEIALGAGKAFGKVLKDNKISTVVFDRNGYRYHGRVKAFADGVREQGILF